MSGININLKTKLIMKEFRQLLSAMTNLPTGLYTYLVDATEAEAKEALEVMLENDYDIVLDSLYAHLPCNMVEREVNFQY